MLRQVRNRGGAGRNKIGVRRRVERIAGSILTFVARLLRLVRGGSAVHGFGLPA